MNAARTAARRVVEFERAGEIALRQQLELGGDQTIGGLVRLGENVTRLGADEFRIAARTLSRHAHL
ncbi:MAG TPA: hypothetical protein VLW85_08285, partial [Myxococcales bacterium]|nr:hypothetical protein [Myxococcales bacterium]